MAFRRRNVSPPYEVMGTAQNAGTPRPPGSVPPSVISKAPSDRSASPATGFWARSKTPIHLRLPRGLLAAAALAFLAALALAYWVGHARGVEAEARRQQEQRQAEDRMALAVKPPVTPDPGPAPPPSPVPTAEPHSPAQRQIGLNYMVLCRYPRADADRLVAFLARNGVDAAAVPSTMSGSFHVVALRGFAAGTLTTPAAVQYERQLKQLGRKWKLEEKGPTEFADSFWQKYKGG